MSDGTTSRDFLILFVVCVSTLARNLPFQTRQPRLKNTELSSTTHFIGANTFMSEKELEDGSLKRGPGKSPCGPVRIRTGVRLLRAQHVIDAE